VVNGAGAAAIACTALIKAMGVRHDNVIMCDRSGTIWRGRSDSMDQWKSAHAVDTPARTLEEALVGADIFLACRPPARKPEYVKAMAPQPIIFAMANPDPEITRPKPRRPGRTASSPPAVRTIRTRSTTCWASPSSSAARWTFGRPRSTRR
jgi:malate dehydrogenase (oxaloacetate-decarboxylating)(NADP+)